MSDITHEMLILRLERRQKELKRQMTSRAMPQPIAAAADKTRGSEVANVADIDQYRNADQSRTSLRVELGRIEAALARHLRGLYGFCCSCELDIEPERLIEDPSAAFCEPCFGDVVEERRRQGYHVR